VRAALPLSDLAPDGVYRATRVTPGAGALLPHRFTLACASRLAIGGSSLWHFPASHLDWVLPSTAPCGVRTFLGPVVPVRGRPADSPPLNHVGIRAGPDGQAEVRCGARRARTTRWRASERNTVRCTGTSTFQ